MSPESVTIGKSADKVFRLLQDDGSHAYLKIGGHQVSDEYERLKWLQGRLPVARILAFENGDGEYRLLTSAIPGIMAHECKAEEREQVVRNIGGTLRKLHAIPAHDCPFDHTIETQIAKATANTDAGLVDESDFDEAHLGMTAQELLPNLLANRPKQFDNVFTHGDYCLPNIIVDPHTLEVTGFIDLGQAGISDRYIDLAIALNTLDHNFGPGYEQIFFDAYGIKDVHWDKIKFYQMLDEFF